MADAAEHGASENDDILYLRTNDQICLSCLASTSSRDTVERVCLGAEGFGNRMCSLENLSSKDVPPDISMCVFVLEQALSVRALQEMISDTTEDSTAAQSGHKTLLYGHAILLRHLHSQMYLSCLSTSSSNDKLAFDVGLQEAALGESCWWTIHPASKQRSEGEKVRVGDDLILVSVSSERYLHIGSGNSVIASFQQTLWNVSPFCSGAIKQKSIGYVFGSSVLRLFHGHMEECLTVPQAGTDDIYSAVMYETGAVCQHARSLWQLDHIRTKWAGAFIGWGHQVRIRHVTSGRYLAVVHDNQILPVHRTKADEDSSVFFILQSKDEKKQNEGGEGEGMGTADLQYGDTMFYIQHCATGLWLSYQTFETKKKGVGKVEEKKAVMLVEGHMDDGFTVRGAQVEESRSARVIRKCLSLFHRFIKALDSLKSEGVSGATWSRISLKEVLECLEDLIEYFSQPGQHEEHEDKQNKLKALRNRQDLFQEEGMIALILETIDKFSLVKGKKNISSHASTEDTSHVWDDISSYLYLLLAAMIRGNRANCAQFAQSYRLDWLVNRLESQQSSMGVLEVLHCVLIDSPEALNMIKEKHIKSIISLIDKHGRDSKVLEVLNSLCVGNGVAVRLNQNLICDNLLPGRDLLLQTRMVDQVTSMRPSIFVCMHDGSAMYTKWYFEAAIDHVSSVTHLPPLLRVGWANSAGFVPFPGSGEHWGANGAGDDLFSYAFDGTCLWTGGKPKQVRPVPRQLEKGDIIGCALDLTGPIISFSLNGQQIGGFFTDFNTDGFFFPVISLSANVSCRFIIGGDHGRLKHGPPPAHSPLYESMLPKEKLRIESCFHFGEIDKHVIFGPTEIVDNVAFTPYPVDTSQIQLPAYIENVRDRLAENIHEIWCMNKIEQGWTYGERRDDTNKAHPFLTTFERLPMSEKKYDITLAYETLRTLLALGCHITLIQLPDDHRMKVTKLPNHYTQPNGYRPAPLDLSSVQMGDKLYELVDLLAENTHNVWARDRIKQGWTYGIHEDAANKRTPHLVPYSKVDQNIMKCNRETATALVKTILAYGYVLEPFTSESGEDMLAAMRQEVSGVSNRTTTRTYRAELTYAVTAGKWYYEVEVLTPGYMKFGWTKVTCDPNHEIGYDGHSFAFEGSTGTKWHQGPEAYGKMWQVGDVIGVMLDLHDQTISFSLNGELMMDGLGQEIAFRDVNGTCGYVPAMTLDRHQKAKLNFGQDVNSLKYFSYCGLQEGYEPFCVNMTRAMPMWFAKDLALFNPITPSHPSLQVVRTTGTNSPPCLKVISKSFGTLDSVHLEYLRLSMSVKCRDQLISREQGSPSTDFEKVIRTQLSSHQEYSEVINDVASNSDENSEGSFDDSTKDMSGAPSIASTSVASLYSVGDEKSRQAYQSHSSLQRGYTQDDSISASDRRQAFRQRSQDSRPHHQTLDDSAVKGARNSPMKSAASESNLSITKQQPMTLTVPVIDDHHESLASIVEKVKSKTLDDKTRRTKSPFKAIFHRSKSRENSHLNVKPETRTGSFRLTSKVNKPARDPKIGLEEPRSYIPVEFQDALAKSTFNESSFDDSEFLNDDELNEVNASIADVNDYYYGVRVLPGQDPFQVYVGWVTPGFHMTDPAFDVKHVRRVIVSTIDSDSNVTQSVSRKNCYMVSAGDLHQRYAASLDTSDRRSSHGLLIGCIINTATGGLSFTVNGKEVANKFQVEGGMRLFPAVIAEPTTKEMVQFEMGRVKNTLPLSACMFRGPKSIVPNCPTRVDIQTLVPTLWSRVPDKTLRVHVIKLSDIRGWSMLCEEPVPMMAVHIPEEDRSVDVLELIENTDMLDFHAKTLDLYMAVCSHGNHKVAHVLTDHVDEKQLTYCTKSSYLSGPLRYGFHNLLIAIHLKSHAHSRLLTQNEFIIPLTVEMKSLSLYRKPNNMADTYKIKQTIANIERSISLRPELLLDANNANQVTEKKEQTAPSYPIVALKQHMMKSLREAVVNGSAHIRDPIGGSNANLFVPLLKICDNLLLMNMLDDDDIYKLLCLIDPTCFDERYEKSKLKVGLLHMTLAEDVKLELCHILQHLCDCQMRHRIESLVAFSTDFVGECQSDQVKRYADIKQSDLSPAIAAKRTREFRCPPQQQMKALLSFKSDEETELSCPSREDLRESLRNFHRDLLKHSSTPVVQMEPVNTSPVAEETPMSLQQKLLQMVWKAKEEMKEAEVEDDAAVPNSLQTLIARTIVRWAEESFIHNQDLVRAMFSLLHRQYDGIPELMRSVDKTYAINSASNRDIYSLLKALGNIRSLLLVQAGPDEEELMKNSLRDLMDNKVFFQHPDLMRALCVHETVMQLMVNTLNKAQQQQSAAMSVGGSDAATTSVRNNTVGASTAEANRHDKDVAAQSWNAAAEMVVMCCRFLCYFCRTSRQNQRAMFEHLSYLLDNSSMLLSRPSLRGSCPLDVAYSSLMDNTELALALREIHLEKITMYLSRCGIQSNLDLIELGYPDIGWDPVEGERFLDFFRFCVWINGDTVEENANLVVRLLIRRPECLGPALKGEGGGLLKAMKDGIRMSKQIAAFSDSSSSKFLSAVTDDDTGGQYLFQSKYNFEQLPPKDNEDYIDMGGAILMFYSGLVDLLGRCAPDAESIKAGRSSSVRARSILRSLVSMADLEGVLGLQFILPITPPSKQPEPVHDEEGEPGGDGLPPGLLPIHKAAIVLFLERVYGIPDQATFFRLLEDGFLPDMRAATTLDTACGEDASSYESDMALALNRYLCASVLPLLTQHAEFFQDADHVSSLVDTTLHTAYRLSWCRSLTKGQRDTVSDFLVAFTNQLRPPMMTRLLRKLTVDVPALSDNAVVPLRLLTEYYERCGRYYDSGGGGSLGSASEEEKRLTMLLFTGIFDALAKRDYDPELFSRALPCLSAIGCALSPDYAMSHRGPTDFKSADLIEEDLVFNPQPVDTHSGIGFLTGVHLWGIKDVADECKHGIIDEQEIGRKVVILSSALENVVSKFSEHYHDCWCVKQIDQGWIHGNHYDDDKKTHPLMKPFHLLSDKDKSKYTEPVRESFKAMLSWGWVLDQDQSRSSSNRDSMKRRGSKTVTESSYSPKPYDLRNTTLTREMQNLSEKLAENSHNAWAKKKRYQMEVIGGGVHPQLVPFDILTDKEKKETRNHAQEMLRFLQFMGYRIASSKETDKDRRRQSRSRPSKESDDSGVGVSAIEKRFAYSLLEKLLDFLDKAGHNMQQNLPSDRFSRQASFKIATEDVKFFTKVVLPFVERYFRAHRLYFVALSAAPQNNSGMASAKEKEMTASLFCKLAQTLRTKMTAFSHDVNISVRCLQVLVQAIDARTVVKTSPEIVRSSILPFFNNAAYDLSQLVDNLLKARFSHVKGTITKGATSLNYVHMVLLPVLSSLFDHLGAQNFGADLMEGEIQLASYRILNSLYTLGTSTSSNIDRDTIAQELERHRPILGECIAWFAGCFPVAFLEPDLNKNNRHSILYGIEGNLADHSLEAQDVMEQLSETLPPLDKIVEEIEELASGKKEESKSHVILVTLPMLCSYLPFWWAQSTENMAQVENSQPVTRVTSKLMNSVLGNVLKLIFNNIGVPNLPWMNRIASRTQPIIGNSTRDLIKNHFLPVAQKLRDNAKELEASDKGWSHERKASEIQEDEANQQEKFTILVRDIYAFFPLLIKYVDMHRSHWLKHPSIEGGELFKCVSDIFLIWTKSSFFKREEQNFVILNEIDNLALIMPSQAQRATNVTSKTGKLGSDDRKATKRRERRKFDDNNSLNVACLKRLLPVGVNMFGGHEQELIQQCKERLFQKESDVDLNEFVSASLLEHSDEGDADEKYKWQKQLYRKIGSTDAHDLGDRGNVVRRIVSMAKVLHGLHLIEHPSLIHRSIWKKVISTQRKRAVMACFRMIPIHSLPRHRAINFFLQSYKQLWLDTEVTDENSLIDDITESKAEEEEMGDKKESDDEVGPDPLTQLITALSRSATKERTSLHDDFLYMSYADIMSKSCSGDDEDDEDENEDDPGSSFQEQEMAKQQLLSEQARLAERGVAEMILMYISASKGRITPLVAYTIDLGISILRGGNREVQKKMYKHLSEKNDVGFFVSVAGIMQQCSVLDLDAFERINKAEGLGVMSDGNAQEKNLHDAQFTCKLFRFLQLLCEGHNLEWQNYLRTQAGNTTTVNLIISTVDYLLRLQESLMDFYWHYSGKDTIDDPGKDNFCRAILVAKQVFITLTEYIQGPCSLNQLALAHSRLWDAVGGFLYIFAQMQNKLSRDADQLGLLREFMTLQKEMMIMLLSMLEGNVMNGPIGKQMVDTLVESSANVEMILRFFDIFLKMKDLTTSEAFLLADVNQDGYVSRREFKHMMDEAKLYTEEEIEYIMMCVDSNQDGKVDFHEFTDRFHNPAKDIGFTMAVLLTNLSEHMPNDPRLERLLEKAKSVLDYFQPYLGRIEIMGSSNRIERVYFEITQSHIDQWEKPQIKESKRSFLHSVVNEGGDKEKLESFVNFCEDTIFEMQHATSISAEEQRIAAMKAGGGDDGSMLEPVRMTYRFLRGSISKFFSIFTWSNAKHAYKRFRSMTYFQLLIAFIKMNLRLALLLLTIIFHIIWTLIKFVANMMMGEKGQDELVEEKPVRAEAIPLPPPPSPRLYPGVEPMREPTPSRDKASSSQSNGHCDVLRNGEAVKPDEDEGVSIHSPQTSSDQTAGAEETPLLQVPEQTHTSVSEDATSEEGTDGGDVASEGRDEFDYKKYILSLFARNFYNFKYAALLMVFAINVILLFYKVNARTNGGSNSPADETNVDASTNSTDASVNGTDSKEVDEYLRIMENVLYLEPILCILAVFHSLVSFSMLVAYYCLKVPLVIFKREKEIARKLEFDSMWIAEQPSDDNIRSLWDKLVLSTQSFPQMYWDKFVKKKVRNKYSELYDYDAISSLLGMEKGDSIFVEEETTTGMLPSFLSNIDFQYQIWKWGAIFTDNSFLYIVGYFLFSVMGNFNYFFFAAHLIDIAVSFKTLRTILQSVTHNGKQLVLTVILTCVVVYMYTVIAFNFFRKFYVKEEDGAVDYKCQDMLTCFVYHLHTGVRAGGGIGDEIESADGDVYEGFRILFDITFFFFVIVILLAIIQGLIIDAFGDLRDRLEQVKEDMESKCFICGIGKDYFDSVPHGFDTHVMYEHNFANYMFFLMHLINKPDTEYTGQESYVWELYQNRSWDFFPVGDCFRKQYEDEATSQH